MMLPGMMQGIMQGGFWIILAAGFNASALALLRTAGVQIKWHNALLSIPLSALLSLAAGLALYAVALVITLRILALYEFIIAVPLFVGVQFIFTSILAYGIFNETLGTQGWVGILIIFIGICVLATGSK